MSKPKTIGDGPVQDEYADQMRVIASVIDEYFNGKDKTVPKRAGFILMTFPFGAHEGRCNYMSNASREDIIVLLKEQLARFEGGAFKEGRA